MPTLSPSDYSWQKPAGDIKARSHQRFCSGLLELHRDAPELICKAFTASVPSGIRLPEGQQHNPKLGTTTSNRRKRSVCALSATLLET